MDRHDRNWESLKRRYLRDARRALSTVKGARVGAVLDDVRAHLDQRLAELEPARRTPDGSALNEPTKPPRSRTNAK